MRATGGEEEGGEVPRRRRRRRHDTGAFAHVDVDVADASFLRLRAMVAQHLLHRIGQQLLHIKIGS